MLRCTLCDSSALQEIVTENDPRTYLLCGHCHLIFAHPDYHLSKESEKDRYVQHNNGIEHPGYVEFLNRAIVPTLPFLHPGMKGLDYGCGPVPTLSRLLENHGITCFNYDPVFDFNHPLESYDFIFATECLEHFCYPKNDLKQIRSLLKPGACLSIMTERWDSLKRFRTWYYKKDPTHISFFNTKTFQYISEEYNLETLFQDRNRVIIFKNK